MSYAYSGLRFSYFKLFITNLFLKQAQIVLRGDLNVRLNFQPILCIIVWIISPQEWISFLQSSYLGVKPMGESMSSCLICFLVIYSFLIVNKSVRYELKEWQINVALSGL